MPLIAGSARQCSKFTNQAVTILCGVRPVLAPTCEMANFVFYGANTDTEMRLCMYWIHDLCISHKDAIYTPVYECLFDKHARPGEDHSD